MNPKQYLLFIALIYFVSISFVNTKKEKQFSEHEKKKANTAADAAFMNSTEKEVIYYVNLCRITPQKFLALCIDSSDYILNHTEEINEAPEFLSSLRTTLKKMKHLPALQPDKKMYELALCFAKEQGSTEDIGHERKKCKDNYGAECITYGNPKALDIVIDLLLDLGVSDYGHRMALLDKAYTKIGVSIGRHKKYSTMAVLDLE